MKKTSLIALTIALMATMFTGCRRPQPDTTVPTTARVTVPATSSTRRPEPTVTIPSPTELLPEGTTGPTNSSDMGRGRMGPRF